MYLWCVALPSFYSICRVGEKATPLSSPPPPIHTFPAAVSRQHRVQSCCCCWPTRCAELCLLSLWASRIRTIVVILIFVCRFEPLSIGSHLFDMLARVASRRQFAYDCQMTAATSTGPRVTGNGHWSPRNKYLNLLLLLLHALPFDNDFVHFIYQFSFPFARPPPSR